MTATDLERAIGACDEATRVIRELRCEYPDLATVDDAPESS